MICTAMETSKLTAEGIIGEAVRIGARMSGGEFPIEIFPIRIQRIISSLHDCQGYPVDYVAAAILAAIAVGIGNSHLVQVKRNWQESSILYMEIYIIRFCLIIQLARWTCGECDKHTIDLESVNRAILLTEYFRTTAVKVQTAVSQEQLSELHRNIYLNLPHRFTTAEGIGIAESYGMKEHAFKMFLKRHIGTLFRKENHGEYSK